MTPEQAANLRGYAVGALLGALVATGVLAGQMLLGSDPLTWDTTGRLLIGTAISSFFGALATAGYTAMQPRAGSEDLAKQVDTLKGRGIARKDMLVMRRADVPPATLRKLGLAEEREEE